MNLRLGPLLRRCTVLVAIVTLVLAGQRWSQTRNASDIARINAVIADLDTADLGAIAYDSLQDAGTFDLGPPHRRIAVVGTRNLAATLAAHLAGNSFTNVGSGLWQRGQSAAHTIVTVTTQVEEPGQTLPAGASPSAVPAYASAVVLDVSL